MTDSVLAQVHVVLYEPQNPINIAAVVRAMKNMGVSSLRLVRPVEYDARFGKTGQHETVPRRDYLFITVWFDPLFSYFKELAFTLAERCV